MRVAVVEDDAVLGALLADTVHARGHEVAVFQTAEAAWDSLQKEPYALLLINQMLPGLGGLTLCRRVRQLPWGREAVIVVLAAHARAAEFAAALDAGADDLLARPIERDLLEARLTIAERQVALLRTRWEVEAALQAREERFRVLFRDNPEPMWVYDLETLRFLEVNETAVARYGYTRDEFLAMRLTDIRPSGDAERLCDDVAGARADVIPPPGEWRHRLKDGRLIDVLISAHALTYEGRAARLIVAHDITARRQAEEQQRVQAHLLNTVGQAVIATDRQGIITYWNRAAEQLYGWTAPETVGRSVAALMPALDAPDVMETIAARLRAGQSWMGELWPSRRDGSTFPALVTVAPISDARGELTGSVSVSADITPQKEAEDAIRFQAHLLNMVGQAIAATDLQGTVIYWNHAAERLYGWAAQEALGRHIAEVMPAPSGQPLAAEILAHIASGQDWSGEQVHRHREGHTFPALITATPVLDQAGAVIGGVGITTDITAQKAAEVENQQHVERLSALRAIDVAITTSLDVRATLSVVLDQVTTQLGVHAAAVLLLNKHTQILEYAAGRGFQGTTVPRLRLRLGEGHAGRAALERRRISAPDLAQDQVTSVPLVAEEQFVAYVAVPLIAQGQVQGVLEVFHRVPLNPKAEWLEYLETLAGQAAIAIHTDTLFAERERSTTELTLAYDTTIEGWSRALDLRDKETEGHSQRVTALTLALARDMGMSDTEMVHVRRGALLHDIGKMGIPDAILLKPEPLTEEEWAVMRRHPVYAYELLSPIAYLRPALDIPHQHHEKWDGTGYPQGLRGEQIALAARIFAVVDVWDALTSERPYRPAWSVEQTRVHLQSLSGSHFDPAVVETFLQLGLGDHPPDADAR